MPAPCSVTPRCNQGVSPPQRGHSHAPGSVACLLLSGEAGGVVEGAVCAGASGASGGPTVWRLRVRRGHARTANTVHAHTVGDAQRDRFAHRTHGPRRASTRIQRHMLPPGAADARTSTFSRCHALSITSLRMEHVYVTIYHNGTLSIITLQRPQRAENKGRGGVVLTHCRVTSYLELTKVGNKI